jgi:hypothetical protein
MASIAESVFPYYIWSVPIITITQIHLRENLALHTALMPELVVEDISVAEAPNSLPIAY